MTGLASGPDPGPPAGDAVDAWSRWILRDRFGDDPAELRRFMDVLGPIRDRVLAGARLRPGETVLDVGCGDGLLGFPALDRVAPDGRVIFADISRDLVRHCRRWAGELGVLDRCGFVLSALPDLAGVADGAADAAVLRSVLIYVADKPSAFRHLHRVLRPRGRLSLFEPVNRFAHPEPQGWLWGFDVTGLEPAAERVKAVAARLQPADSPMLDFDERDLLRWAEEAGFADVGLTYEAHLGARHPAAGTDLDTFLRSAPNPTVPTRGRVLQEAVEEQDRKRLEARMAQGLATGTGRTREALSYLTAVRA